MGSYKHITVCPGDGMHPPDLTLHFGRIHPAEGKVSISLDEGYRLAEDLLGALLEAQVQQKRRPMRGLSLHLPRATLSLRQKGPTITMETKIRSPDDRRFDLDAVTQCLAIVQAWRAYARPEDLEGRDPG